MLLLIHFKNASNFKNFIVFQLSNILAVRMSSILCPFLLCLTGDGTQGLAFTSMHFNIDYILALVPDSLGSPS